MPWSVETAHCVGLPGLTAMSIGAATDGASRALPRLAAVGGDLDHARVLVAQREDPVAVDLDLVVVGLAEPRDRLPRLALVGRA